MINTAERRRSAIDFGKGPMGTGAPIPSGSISAGARAHILNLYSGIAAETDFFFFWRKRTTTGNTGFANREVPSSTWGKGTDAEEDIFVKGKPVRDS